MSGSALIPRAPASMVLTLPAVGTPGPPSPGPVAPGPVAPVLPLPAPVDNPIPLPLPPATNPAAVSSEEQSATIAAWLSDYPSLDDPNLSGKLASIAEFALLAGKAVEPPPKAGEQYPHQKLFQRLYDVYDNVLVMDAPGTGKSCLVAALTEFLKRQFLAEQDTAPSLLKPATFKRAYVLGLGDIIEKNFRTELACRCTKEVYQVPELGRMTAESRQSQISKQISKYYTVSTYRRFAAIIQNLSDQVLSDEFDGCVFIIDEAHNLIPHLSDIIQRAQHRVDEATRRANRARHRAQAAQRRNDINARRLRGAGAMGPAVVAAAPGVATGPAPAHTQRRPQISLEDAYNILFRLFHVLRRCKVILLSATPARAKPVEEFAALINLLRPLDRQMPLTGPDGTPMTLDEFGEWVRGYIVYVRELDTGVDFRFIGRELSQVTSQVGPGLTIVVQPLEMSPFQSQVYTNAYAQYQNLHFYDKVIQATQLVYPNGTFGTDGFLEYVIDEGQGRWSFTPAMIAALNANRHLVTADNPGALIYPFSTKFAFLTNAIYRYHAERKKGYIFQRLKEGSGVIPLGLLLEQAGIERYYRRESAFRGAVGTNTGFCAERTLTERTTIVEKRLRYGLLVPEIPADVLKSTLELFNSPENRYGEYIAVLAFSPVGKEGISIQDVQWVAEDSAWLWPSAKQSIFRGRRSTSHLGLLASLPPGTRLPLDVIQMAAYPGPPTQGVFSVDFHMYQEAELTARETAPYITRAKQVANDCYLEYDRNVRPGDAELAGTADCDFGDCVYECLSDAPAPMNQWDYSGLIRKYSDDYRTAVLQAVKRLSQRMFAIPLTAILAEVPTVPYPVILVEISRLIDDRAQFTNRFGQAVYYHLSGGHIVLSPDYPSAAPAGTLANFRQLSQLRYLTSIPAVRQRTLREYLKDQDNRQPERLDILTGTPEAALTDLAQLTISQRSNVLEEAVTAAVTAGGIPVTAATAAILNHFQPKIFALTAEPTGQIQDLIRKYQRSRGQHAPIPPPPTGTPGPIYINTLLSIPFGEKPTEYDISTQSGKPKILRLWAPNAPGAPPWRDANWVEAEVYTGILTQLIKQREAPLEQNQITGGIYGFVLLDDPDQKFRLIVPNTTNRREEDLRTVGRGHVCGTYKWPELARITYQIGLSDIYQPDPTLSPTEIENIINAKIKRKSTDPPMDATEARYVATFIRDIKSHTIGQVCNNIRIRLGQLGLIAVR